MQYRANRTKTDVIALLSAEGEREPVQIVDISRDGAKVTTPYPYQSGTATHLIIDGARLAALIQWSSDGFAGLRFLDRLDRDTLIHIEQAGFAVSGE
jgi:hypothetical protein